MNWLSKILSGLLLLVFLFFGLKGCVVTVWSSGPDYTAYSVDGADGRSMLMVFMPKSEVMIWYQDPNTKSREGVLITMRGSYGTHYLGPLWRVKGPGTLLGWRWITDDMEPVHMEVTVLEKYREGLGDSAFPDVRDRNYMVVYVGKDRLRFQKTLLTKRPITEAQVQQLLHTLGQR